MSRNFGSGSRVIANAGRMALDRSANRGEVTKLTAATNAQRWEGFSAWLKAGGLNRMEHITRETVKAYGQWLAAMVCDGEMAPATAQNYVSAVNTVMTLASEGQWQSVSPTKECGIASRNSIRAEAPGVIDRARYGDALDQARGQLDMRAAPMVELARELGLRGTEGSLLDARVAMPQAKRIGSVPISAAAKGGLMYQVEKLSRSYARKGGEGNRRQQRARMMAFAKHAAGLGAREMGQVGARHVISYWKASRGLSDATLYAHWLAIRELWRAAYKVEEPPRPRIKAALSEGSDQPIA